MNGQTPGDVSSESEEVNSADYAAPTLGLLPASYRPPERVSRENTLRIAETLMLMHDFSQLPVMTCEKTVHGLISWKSIGRAHVVGQAGPLVRDCMDPDCKVLPANMPLLKAVAEIIQHEVVLVMNREKTITGIVTTTDLSMQLRALTDAFLLVGNIERQLRRLIDGRYSPEVLKSMVHSPSARIVKGVDDLSFGEYVRLLQAPDHWKQLGLKVDQGVVLKRLEDVRQIRNAVMHFRSEAADAIDIERLHQTELFLASLKAR